MTITLHGHVPSKKNSKRLVYAGHRPVMISSKAHEAWHTVASYELKSQVKGSANRIALSGPKQISITIFGATRRKEDLTNKAESLMDLLVDNFVLADDNWEEVPEIYLRYGGYDKANPRAEIEISAVKVGKPTSKKS
jgi:Holliday junction resolvase RusA-like endonuclease